MTLIIEDGSGVHGANSGVSIAFVTAYLTARGRETENGWSTAAAGLQEGACIEATDYVENKHRHNFKGSKQYRDLSVARAALTLTAQPLAAETVVVGSLTYTFEATLTSAGDVLIGASTSESIDNLIKAINSDGAASGVTHHASTVENTEAGAQSFFGDAMLAFAKTGGTPGNAVASTTTITGALWSFATLNGGGDPVRAQPLSFPRIGLVDGDGIQINGMPERYLQALAEYAVRSVSTTTTLAPDPTVDSIGGTITSIREKVGPIETATVYSEGTANSGTLPAYPAADRLLRDFVRAGGRTVRG